MIKKRELIENLGGMRTFTIKDEGMQELVDSIGKLGLRTPLLIYDNKVIDGARRVSALKILGHELVDIEIAEDMIEVAEAVGAVAKKQPLTMDRVVDLLTDIAPYTNRRSSRPGGKERWYALHPELPQVTQWGRQTLEYATGSIMSISALMRLSYLIARAAEGDKLSAEMLVQIRLGKITPHQGRLMTEGATPKLTGPTKAGAEQRRVLENGTANLQAALQAFNTLGAPLRVSSEIIDEAVLNLQTARFEIQALVQELKKERSRKETKKT